MVKRKTSVRSYERRDGTKVSAHNRSVEYSEGVPLVSSKDYKPPMKKYVLGKAFNKGDRVVLVEEVDVYPDGVYDQGETGTVVGFEEEGFYRVKLDNHYPSLDEWNNELWVYDKNAPNKNDYGSPDETVLLKIKESYNAPKVNAGSYKKTDDDRVGDRVIFNNPEMVAWYIKRHPRYKYEFLNEEEWIMYYPEKKRWLKGEKDVMTPSVLMSDKELIQNLGPFTRLELKKSMIYGEWYRVLPGDVVSLGGEQYDVVDWENRGDTMSLVLDDGKGGTRYADIENSMLKVVR